MVHAFNIISYDLGYRSQFYFNFSSRGSVALIHGSKYFQISTFYVMVVYKYLASDVALLITNLV